jgi:hypothetical protein
MPVPFAEHVALLEALLDRRQAIVDLIESRLLNVQGKDVARGANREQIQRLLDACFYDLPGLAPDPSRFRGQLAAAHLADGFEPVSLEHASHVLDPIDLILGAHRHWERHRWPGRNGRDSFARAVFGVFMLGQLEALSLRIWDDGTGAAGGRLDRIQRLLDGLNQVASSIVLIRDARWLIQTAQGPLTRHLAPYFRVAAHISESFTAARRLELHKAGAQLAGGHLRSQLRYRSAEMHLPGKDPAVVAITRNSNSMDVALLVNDLVPLLEGYAAAQLAGEVELRIDLADAILQGVSADPELLLMRLDLLEPCSTIETLFLEPAADGTVRSTVTGATHAARVTRYRELIGQAAAFLKADAGAFDPAQRPYSPLGITYGFCADILSAITSSTLVSPPSHDLSLEDMFMSRGRLAEKLTRTGEWQRLPRAAGHQPLEHSSDWAGEIYQRTMTALGSRAAHPTDANASGVASARLFVVPRDRTVASGAEAPDLQTLPPGIVAAQEHCVTSDVNRAFDTGATAFPKSQILIDRNEGRFLASAEIDGKWLAVSKTVLTAILGQGKDALVTDVPGPVIDILTVTCGELIVVTR